MDIVRGHGINDIFPKVFDAISSVADYQTPQPSRNGPVYSFQEPFVVHNLDPRCRVLLCPERRNNPFLDFFESLNTFRFSNTKNFMVENFGPRFEGFANNGFFHGHYGHRLRCGLNDDQVQKAIDRLRKDPNDRRVVLTLFEKQDLFAEGMNDIPCNTQVFLRIRSDEVLDLAVMNRSNDIFWGMLGVNNVFFSMLQELIANELGIMVGHMYQISVNAHAYTQQGPFTRMRGKTVIQNLTVDEFPHSLPPYNQFIDDLGIFFSWVGVDGKPSNLKILDQLNTAFFHDVVIPMWSVFKGHKDYIACPHWRAAVELYQSHD